MQQVKTWKIHCKLEDLGHCGGIWSLRPVYPKQKSRAIRNCIFVWGHTWFTSFMITYSLSHKFVLTYFLSLVHPPKTKNVISNFSEAVLHRLVACGHIKPIWTCSSYLCVKPFQIVCIGLSSQASLQLSWRPLRLLLSTNLENYSLLSPVSLRDRCFQCCPLFMRSSEGFTLFCPHRAAVFEHGVGFLVNNNKLGEPLWP